MVVVCQDQASAASSARVHVQDAVSARGKDVTLPLHCPGETSLELAVDDYRAGRVLSVSVTPLGASGPGPEGALVAIPLAPGCTSSVITLASPDAAMAGDARDAASDRAEDRAQDRNQDRAEDRAEDPGDGELRDASVADAVSQAPDLASPVHADGSAPDVPHEADSPDMAAQADAPAANNGLADTQAERDAAPAGDAPVPLDVPVEARNSAPPGAADASPPPFDAPPEALAPGGAVSSGGSGFGGAASGGAGSGGSGGAASGGSASGGSGGAGSGGSASGGSASGGSGTGGSASGGSASGGAASGGSDAPPPPRCNLSKPFGPAVPAPVPLSGGGGGRLSPDELTLYYALDLGNGQWDIVQATRTSILSPFTNVVPIPGLNSPWLDASGTVTADGLIALVETTRGGDYQIYIASRPATTEPFATPTRMNLGPSSGDGGPFVTIAGNAVYYHSLQSGHLDLFRAGLQGTTNTPGVPLTSLNTPGTESGPVVTADELTIFFFSYDRDGVGHGQGDIWSATRSSPAQDFGPARNVDELNTLYTEAPTWISPDGCRLYFDRTQPNGTGGAWLYADRPPN